MCWYINRVQSNWAGTCQDAAARTMILTRTYLGTHVTELHAYFFGCADR